MNRYGFALVLVMLLVAAGCLGTQKEELPVSTPAPAIPTDTRTSVPATVPAIPSAAPTTIPTTIRTATPLPTPTPISEVALNARIVDARNKLNNLIESDVADTVITHPANAPGCEVKQSRELGYLIDVTTGESTFVKGDYWSIDASLFREPMRKDHEYVIIHTHPRMWATCQGSGIVSLYTFSIGDLEATAALSEQGYRIKYLIALSDKEYRIWPKVEGDWKSHAEIRQSIRRIETRLETPFTYHDTLLDRDFYEVDSLMPLLAKELNYSYTANNHVMA